MKFMSPCFSQGMNRRGLTPAGKEHPSIESPPGGIRRDRENPTGENMRMPSSTAACRYLRFAAFAAVISSELLKAARTSICNFCSVSGYRSRWYVTEIKVVAIVSVPANLFMYHLAKVNFPLQKHHDLHEI